MIIASIDYSLTCPAICVYNTEEGQFSLKTCRFYFNQQSSTNKIRAKRYETLKSLNIFESIRFSNDNETIRYYLLADWALSVLISENVDTVSLEAYALGATGLVFNIAEATGILKHYLFTQGIQVYTFPPSQNKKIFSGKGNANKALMIDTFNQIHGINIAEQLGKITLNLARLYMSSFLNAIIMIKPIRKIIISHKTIKIVSSIPKASLSVFK